MKGRRTTALRAFALLLVLAVPTRPAAAATKVSNFAPPPTPSEAEPMRKLQKRLASVDSADVSRACGNLTNPWAYRGPAGKKMALRSYGRRHGERDWAQAAARLLIENAVPDTARMKRRDKAACDLDNGPPVFLSNFYTHAGPTLALVSFDEDHVEFFDADGALGHFRLGAAADSLWAALGSVLDTDPLFRGPRPPVSKLDTLASSVWVDELPSVREKVAPKYPGEAILQDVSGVVMVTALVGEDGKVHDAYILKGPWPLRDAALEAVWQWEFDPAVTKNQPVAVWVAVPVSFKLR